MLTRVYPFALGGLAVHRDTVKPFVNAPGASTFELVGSRSYRVRLERGVVRKWKKSLHQGGCDGALGANTQDVR